jgi:hypothetical protein
VSQELLTGKAIKIDLLIPGDWWSTGLPDRAAADIVTREPDHPYLPIGRDLRIHKGGIDLTNRASRRLLEDSLWILATFNGDGDRLGLTDA